jgi:hypothetical protein
MRSRTHFLRYLTVISLKLCKAWGWLGKWVETCRKLTSYDNCTTVKYIVALNCTFLLFYVLLVRNGMDCQKVKIHAYVMCNISVAILRMFCIQRLYNWWDLYALKAYIVILNFIFYSTSYMVFDSLSYNATRSVMVVALLLLVYVGGMFCFIHVTSMFTMFHKLGKTCWELYQLILFFVTRYQE